MSKKDNELQRFRESIVVLHKLINSNGNVDHTLDKIGEAISDLIFGHGIRNEHYLTDDEYKDAENDIDELVNFKERWNK